MRTLLAFMLISLNLVAAEPVMNELPKEWHGTWKGSLKIPGPDGKPTEIPMLIVIGPKKDSSRLSFQIAYGEGDKKSFRNYEILPSATEPGRFQIDEKNSILLDARLVDGVLYSQFEVQENFLAARYELDGDTLKYEVTSSGKPTETGGEKKVPKVKTYPITNVQSAKLKRQP